MPLSVKLLPLALLLYSCMPGEDPVDPFPRGDRQEVFISSGPNKNEVSFFDLEAGAVIATADPMEWDLQVGETLEINYHRFLRVAKTVQALESIQDTAGLEFHALQRDSLQWQLEEGHNYVIDMGKNTSFAHLGFWLLRLEAGLDSVRCVHGPMGQVPQTWTVARGSYVNLREGTYANLPLEYDLSFGKYIHYFETEEIEYEVYGALIKDMEVAVSLQAFDQIDQSSLDSLEWSTRRDAIGYDWKFYNLTKGAYEIDSDRSYVLHTRNGFFYKLRFTNFYDPDGKSGHPTVEFQLF